MHSQQKLPRVQDLAAQLHTDCRRGLPWQDEEDRTLRENRFGTNRLADREEVSFGQLVLEALEVSFEGFLSMP